MWFFKKKTLDSHFNGIVRLKIKGIKFKIKPLDGFDHLQGLNVLQKVHDTFKLSKEHRENPEVTLENLNKIKKYCRDIILAGVVEPKLAANENQDGFPVDKLFNDMTITQELTKSILIITYKKK